MVRFLKSPTGTHFLANEIGSAAELAPELEKELVEKGIAEYVSQTSREVGTGKLGDSKPNTGKAGSKGNK